MLETHGRLSRELVSILNRELLGNTVADLLISLGVVIGVVVLARSLYRLLAFLLRGRGARFGLKLRTARSQVSKHFPTLPGGALFARPIGWRDFVRPFLLF
jgi:hypothetical protein